MASTLPFRNITFSLEKYEDPRTAEWLMVSSPLPAVGTCAFYLFFVNILGPRIMEKRKPFELKRTLIVYNFIHVIFSGWIFYELAVSGWLTGEYNFRCQPIDMSTSPKTMRMVNATWWYFFSKFTELTETIFFVLRKKFNQVNVLHVYHHTIMLMSGWLAIRYYPCGHGTFPGLLNTFIHIIMYFYYLLSACGPSIQKYLWWKKYLTALQLIQFTMVMIHNLQLIFTPCSFPTVFVWYNGLLSLSFYLLFRNFYNKTYKSKACENNKKSM